MSTLRWVLGVLLLFVLAFAVTTLFEAAMLSFRGCP